MQTEQIVFGGGCFWCVEAVLEELRGVVEVTSGYAGGQSANPSYAEVSRGESGHVEVVRVTFDPAVIRLDQLFAVFFATHDPTTHNRQGNDVGEEYRSVIFYTSEAQQVAAQQYIAQLEAHVTFAKPIVTTVEPLVAFYAAEAEHQAYYRRNEGSGYCQVIISPKLAKLRKEFSDLLKG